MRAAVRPTTVILTEMDMEVHPIHSVCAHLLDITMSPTTTIATTQTEMRVLDKAHGLAAIGEMGTLIMTAMAPKPKGTTVEADAVDGLAVPPTMAGTAETHLVETTGLGSRAAARIGSAATKTHKPAHRNAVRGQGPIIPPVQSAILD